MIDFTALYRFIKTCILGKRIYATGLNLDKVDKRDILYKIVRPGIVPKTTNRVNIDCFPYRYDQGSLGSCVGHSITETFCRVLQVNNQPDFEPSRLFAYYIARRDKNNDSGASIRDAFKAINKQGLCSEKTYPYKTCKFAQKPSDEAYREALDHQSIRYERLPQIKEVIMDAVSKGYPVVYGKSLHESFMSDKTAKTGIVPFPDMKKERCYGGHAMVIFDYDQDYTIELNSWGKDWGQNGSCQVPWEYVLDPQLTFDFWVLYTTE